MSKYDPLARFLSARDGTVWEASFDEVERILGDSLPQSARKHRPWWANMSGPGHSQTLGWQSVGWETCDVDLVRERVKFVKKGPRSNPGGNSAPTPHGSPSPRADMRAALLAKARTISGLKDNDVIIDKALESFIHREAGRRLAALGGTMPDFIVPPRERPEW